MRGFAAWTRARAFRAPGRRGWAGATWALSLLLGAALPASASVTDLSIQAIEVTQAIQCLDGSNGYTNCPDNSLELTDNRPVAVRVYIGHDGPACAGADPYAPLLEDVTVTLRWVASEKPDFSHILPDQREQLFDVPCSVELADLREDSRSSISSPSGSATFIIRPERLGIPNFEKLLWVEAEVATDQIQDANPDNDALSIQLGGLDENGQKLRGGLFPRERLTVAWIPVHYAPDPPAGPEPYEGPVRPDLEQAAVAGEAAKRMYPLRVEYRRQPGVFPWISGLAPPPSPGEPPGFLCPQGKCVDMRVEAGELNYRLKLFRELTKPQPFSLMAWLPQGVDFELGCRGKGSAPWYQNGKLIPGGVGWVEQCESPGDDGTLLAHEVAHNKGLDHPKDLKCWPFPDDQPGFDDINETGFKLAVEGEVAEGHVISADLSDFMVQGAGSSAWISPFHWNDLLGKPLSPEWSDYPGCLSETSSRAGKSSAARASAATEGVVAAASQPQPAVVVSGRVHADGTGEFEHLYLLESSGPFPDSDPIGENCLDLRTGSDSTLGSFCFDLSFTDPETDEPRSTDFFVSTLPLLAGTERIVLRTGQAVLDERTASPNGPDLVILAPQGGGQVGGSLDVAWSANDPDGDPLSFAVLYSPDAGNTVLPLAIDTEATEGEIDTTLLPGGEFAQVRILASDGFNTIAVDSTPFQVARKAPEVFIIAPSDGTRIDGARDIVLVGQADDLEDGLLGGPSLSWESDRDGSLGNGSELVLIGGTLSPGDHQITLTATDSDGQSRAAVANVVVDLRIRIDIKPGTAMNPVNPFARGVVPVAVLGSEGLDVTQVDVGSLAFGRNQAGPAHDLTRTGVRAGHLRDVNGDGSTDLVTHYRTAQTGIAMSDVEACLTGSLLDGTPFRGCDAVTTKPRCGLGFELVILLPPLVWLRTRHKSRRV